MKYEKGYVSKNVEDRRFGGGGGGGFRIPGGAKGGVGGAIAVVLALIFGRDIVSEDGTVNFSGDTGAVVKPPPPGQDTEADLKSFVSFVFDKTQEHWTSEFQKRSMSYEISKLVLFREKTRSGCGAAGAEVGPFYCPADMKSYIDLGFYQQLRTQLKAGGDFAQAYVIAHEVGHHVQNLTGTNRKVTQMSKADPSRENDLSIRQELQADCYAGVWAASAKQQGLLEMGDVEEALGAASAVGDDALQKMSGGAVQPETWTHGSSAQRIKWFKIGMEKASMDACDTFAGEP
jgi:predicted metalloprotease